MPILLFLVFFSKNIKLTVKLCSFSLAFILLNSTIFFLVHIHVGLQSNDFEIVLFVTILYLCLCVITVPLKCKISLKPCLPAFRQLSMIDKFEFGIDQQTNSVYFQLTNLVKIKRIYKFAFEEQNNILQVQN